MTACAFCSAMTVAVGCTYEIERFDRAYLLDLEPGDRICRLTEDPRSGVFATVQKVKLHPRSATEENPARRVYNLTILIRRQGKPDRTKVVCGFPLAAVRRAHRGACGKPLCELCAQDLMGGFRCPDHWIIRTMELAA